MWCSLPIIIYLLIFFWKSDHVPSVGWDAYCSLSLALLPNAVVEDASSASRRLMVFLLHMVLLFEAFVLMSLQIAELSQDSVADGECCHFDELFRNVFGFQLRSIEGENT